MTQKIVISIPIALDNRQDIAEAISERYGMDYLFMGRVFQETASNTSCQIDIHPIFEASSNIERLTAATEQKECSAALERNIKQTIYLASADVGYQACLKIARFASIFLNIGGSGVKVESAEITHEAEKWLSKYNSPDTFEIYSLYVGLVEGEDKYYSCGMHNFGKADVSIDLDEDIGLAIYVMNVFNYYRLTETPILQDGHTFQPDIESPRYQIKLLEDKEYEIDSWQHNNLGRWHLKRCQSES